MALKDLCVLPENLSCSGCCYRFLQETPLSSMAAFPLQFRAQNQWTIPDYPGRVAQRSIRAGYRRFSTTALENLFSNAHFVLFALLPIYEEFSYLPKTVL